jgi:hypothetical protein
VNTIKLKTILNIAGIAASIFGLIYLIFPVQAIAMFGLTTNDAGILITRYFGGSFLSFGLVLYFVKVAIDPDEHRAIVRPLFLVSVIGLIVALLGQFSGIVNGLGWLVVLGFAAFAVGFGSHWGKN